MSLYVLYLAKQETGQLKNQIEFLQKANDSLADSFQHYVQSIYYLIIIASIVLGILASFATFLFWNSLREATKSAKEIAEKEVYRVVGESIDREVKILRRSIEREQVVGNTRINYVLFNGDKEPKICQLIRRREFRSVQYYTSLNNINSNNEVLVLDFFTEDFLDTIEREKSIKQVIKLHEESRFKFILVVYVSSAREKRLSPELQQLLDNSKIFWTPANSPLTLMGRVIDAAQMSYASK